MPQSVILADGVEGLYIKNTRFKTARISFNFYLPLSKESVAANALLPCVLTSCSSSYPSFIQLNRKLKELYGAALTQSSTKLDDMQCISIAITTLCDKYTPDNSPVVLEAAKVLADIIFSPRISDNSFVKADVDREKRQLAESIEGEFNEKRIYARARLVEEMFEALPYGLPHSGKASDVLAVDGKQLFDAWQNLLRSAYVRVNAIGDFCPDSLFKATAAAFGAIKRGNITDIEKMVPAASRNDVKRVVEKLEVAQGKLVMGFTSKVWGSNADTDAVSVMADIFGGGPYSLLFENVREKQSLCYYCACASFRSKGFMMVDSGVEAKNAKTAEREILKQLDTIKSGEFSKEIFEASIRNIKDSLLACNDSQKALDNWYIARIRSQSPATPEDMTQRFGKVTMQQVTEVAQGVELNTVYTLMPANYDENKGE